MPPQQPDRLLDLFDEAFDFGAHKSSSRFQQVWRDVTAQHAEGNSVIRKSG